MDMIPLPELYDNDLEHVGYLKPVSLSVDLNITPLSSASMELERGVKIPARSYVELFTSIGSVGFFRVRSPQDAYGEELTTVELESALAEIGDWLIDEKIEGTKTAKKAVQDVWEHYGGDLWQLGSLSGLDGNVEISFHYNSVLEAILSVLEDQSDYMIDMDYSTSPWTLNIIEKSAEVTAEGRLARNVESARIMLDDTELCTRVYYEVPKNSGTEWRHMDSDTIDTYGVIEQTITTDSKYTVEQCEKQARNFLKQHKNPKISVEIDAVDLSLITGEALDTFRIGKVFKLALPEYGISVEESISTLSWDDVYGDPLGISIRLADEMDSLVSYVHSVERSDRRQSQRWKDQEEKSKEFQTRIEQTETDIELWARQTDEQGEILRQAGLSLNADGVLIYATDNVNNIGSKLQVLSDQITAEVIAREGYIAQLGSRITQTASSIRAELWSLDSNLRSYVDLTAARLRAEFEGRFGQTISYFEITSEHLFATFRDEINSKWGEFEVSAEHMLAKFRDDINQLTGKLIVTAEKTESYHRDMINKYESWLTHTAGEISGIIRRLDSIEGSELMLHADEAWMLVNNVSVTQDGKVKFKNGIYINQNGTYMGVFTTGSDNSKVLNAGVAVELLSDGTTTTKIKADYIDFTGYVTMQQLEADYIKTDELAAEIGEITNLVVHNVAADRVVSLGAVTGLTVNASQGLTIGGTDTGTRLKDAFVSVEKTSESGGSVTLRFTSASNATSDVTFSRAGLIEGSWSGDTFTASLSSTGTSSVTTRVDLAAEGAGQTNYTVRAFDRGGQTGNTIKSLSMYLTLEATAKTVSARSGSASGSVVGIIDVSSLYTSGFRAGEAGVTITSAGWDSGVNIVTASNGETLNVNLPPFTVSGGDTFTSAHKTTVYFSGGGASSYLASKEVDASGQYSAGRTYGQNEVTITAAGWYQGVNVVSASNGQTLNVNLPTFTASGGTSFDSEHKTTVTFTGGGAPAALATKEVDASSQYTAGSNAVTLNDFTVATGKITANASNGKTKNITIAQSQAAWDYTAKTKAVTIKAGGIEVLAFDVDGTNMWNHGGQTAHVDKSNQTLGVAGSVTVNAKYTSAAGNESSSSATGASCTITAPTPNPVLEFSDFDTTNGTCKVMAHESGYKDTYHSRQVSVSISLGSWSSGSRTISINAGGTTVAARTLSLPSSLTFTWSNPAQGYVQASVTVGGKTYTGTKKIDSGWL